MGLNIRAVCIADRPAIEGMLADCGAFAAEEMRVALEMVDVGLNDGPDRGYPVFTAECDGMVRGYVCIGPTPLTASTWHLYWICVHPLAQGRGVGRQLQAYAEQYVKARHGRRLVVETSGRPDYQRQRRFYESCGYRMTGRIPDYYKPGDDCVFYYKVLS